MLNVPFNDLRREIQQIRSEIDNAVARVLDRSHFILGPENQAFEQSFARYLGIPHFWGVANGTDAIQIALMAAGIGSGDEVICPALTAAPTALAILAAGAKPVFADIDLCTYTLDVSNLEACITDRTRAVLPVHLYGLPADVIAIQDVADKYSVLVIEDVAQAHGAKLHGKMVGTIAPVSTFSFYPTKNLAAFGDAGGVATHHPDVAERMHCIRDLGQTKRFEHTSMGLNSRLDELQAAILHVKLAYLDQNNEARRERAAWYQELLSDVVGLQLPVEPEGCYHVYHLYVIRHPQRDRLRQHLLDCGIGCDVHYPTSLNRQPVFAQCGLPEAGVPNAELATQEILSLPIYPSLTRSEVEYIAETIRAFQ